MYLHSRECVLLGDKGCINAIILSKIYFLLEFKKRYFVKKLTLYSSFAYRIHSKMNM